jgi:hypothetical protein
MKAIAPAALLVGFILLSVALVTGQGYKSGNRRTADSKIELGVTPCDYWEENDRQYPDGTRQTEFTNGLVVLKRPNMELSIVRHAGKYGAGFDSTKATDITGRWIDREDGGVLDLSEIDSNFPSFQILWGRWTPRNSSVAAIVFNGCHYPNLYSKDGSRFIFWYSYPHKQEYGTGDLTVAGQGQYLLGSYTSDGRPGSWSLVRPAPRPSAPGGAKNNDPRAVFNRLHG